MKKWFIILYLVTFGIPIQALAYSNEVILGGENIGIHINTPGILVIGFYKVNGSYIKGYPEIKVGDYITEVNGEKVSKIEDLTSLIEKHVNDGQIVLTLKRGEETYKTSLTLQMQDNVYKTGLYVKDGITGIGTLSYIDPETKVYGALGHEIVEGTTGTMVEVASGSIFESSVTGIRKSTNGNAGEKDARFNYENVYGNIVNNTNHGLFGEYTKDASALTIPVGNPQDIILGKAYLYTVLEGEKKEQFEIEITKIQEHNDVKNLSFTITDEKLLNTTGGIVQGMSGSPIVQNGKIIGAVTHVIVDNPITGYGIFITTMLEEGDKIKAE